MDVRGLLPPHTHLKTRANEMRNRAVRIGEQTAKQRGRRRHLSVTVRLPVQVRAEPEGSHCDLAHLHASALHFTGPHRCCASCISPSSAIAFYHGGFPDQGRGVETEHRPHCARKTRSHTQRKTQMLKGKETMIGWKNQDFLR